MFARHLKIYSSGQLKFRCPKHYYSKSECVFDFHNICIRTHDNDNRTPDGKFAPEGTGDQTGQGDGTIAVTTIKPEEGPKQEKRPSATVNKKFSPREINPKKKELIGNDGKSDIPSKIAAENYPHIDDIRNNFRNYNIPVEEIEKDEAVGIVVEYLDSKIRPNHRRVKLMQRQDASVIDPFQAITDSQDVEVETSGDNKVCKICESYEGTIFDTEYNRDEIPELPLHPNCRCVLVDVETGDEVVDF